MHPKIKYDDKYYDLTDRSEYSSVKANHLILEEILPFEKVEKERRTFFLAPEQGCKMGQFKIGRENHMNLKFGAEKGVSARHADIEYNFARGNFFIRDKESTYGTLVLVRKGIALEVNKLTKIQVGDTCMIFKLE